ncbi:hypothetical protein H2248_000864 [Termitomyces sp. 'cryptogamus']|nr:hypothetical protein H2248_000864 [Termitomyces sp. 'cryptogamus']
MKKVKESESRNTMARASIHLALCIFAAQVIPFVELWQDELDRPARIMMADPIRRPQNLLALEEKICHSYRGAMFGHIECHVWKNSRSMRSRSWKEILTMRASIQLCSSLELGPSPSAEHDRIRGYSQFHSSPGTGGPFREINQPQVAREMDSHV